MVLLTEYPVMDNTQSIADYAETVAEAQLKKVGEGVMMDKAAWFAAGLFMGGTLGVFVHAYFTGTLFI